MAPERTAQLAASPPLFESDFLNFFSRVHPAIPAILFVPVVVGGVWLGVDRGLGGFESALLLLAGVGIWTLTEYWLHRLVFHWQPRFRGGDRLHFIIHGVHHDHPNDPLRLVMPPSVSVPLALLFYGLFALALGGTYAPLFAAGFLAGYLAYDMTHFCLHHHKPSSRLGKLLRELHMRHHFQDDTRGFGVSAPFWDYVFGTALSRSSRRQA